MSDLFTSALLLPCNLRLSMILIANFVWLLAYANAETCGLANPIFSAEKSLYKTIAVIGPDDRVERTSENTPGDIEKAQARLNCPLKPLSLQGGKLSDKNQLIGAAVANATIAFEDDMALVNRHDFIKEDGRPSRNFRSCYIEHIPSGTFIPIVDAQWPAYKDRSKNMFEHHDIAVVRFKQKLPKGTALNDGTFLIENNPNIREKVTVVSNFAENLPNRRSLTITSCNRFGLYKLANDSQSNIYGTNCDTGQGSSGGQVYVERNGSPKMIGIVSSEVKTNPEGGAWDSKRLSTGIIKFDSTLFETVESMRARQQDQR